MARLLRQAVSQNKRRFQEDGFDLDLTYITPNVIAMGYPSSGAEGLYRNKLEDVKRFLDTYHTGRYKVYNLCVERTYDAEKFENRVAAFPFEDHNCPPLRYLVPFCKSVESWLRSNDENLIAVHCKAGKGRTGIMIAAFLMYSGICPTAESALDYFDAVRTADGKGVTIPSQRRYVQYFERVLKYPNLETPPEPLLLMTQITIHTIPKKHRDGGCDPYIDVYQNMALVYTTRNVFDRRHYLHQRCIVYSGMPLALSGDIKIECNDYDHGLLFYTWFNTLFIDHSKVYVMEKESIDRACKDGKEKVFDAGFKVEIEFQPLQRML